MSLSHSATKRLLVAAAIFQSPVTVAQVDFATDVSPILQQRCLSCHNEHESKGDFSLTTSAVLDSGYIVARDSDSSHLVQLMTSVDDSTRMPKNSDPLSEDEIRLIRKWIDDGAVWPETYRLEESKVTSFDWWSYAPVSKPSIPDLDSDWCRSPIDAFVLRSLQEMNLTPAGEADRRTLIRRLTFDLTGLPPSPRDIEAFERDTSGDAYEKLVDRLLASQAYGERWARHWLDVVKYADTCGYDKDKLRPNAWPYRDYVIQSFNDDKPYSRFVQEQVAGDVLFPGDSDGILGLGFIAAGPWDFIGHVEVPESKIDGKVARNLDRDDMVSNVLNTFCSITIQCARCHNHKFDPITQQHYYGLQSIFAAVDKADRLYDSDPDVEERRGELVAQLTALSAQKTAVVDEIAESGGDNLKSLKTKIGELQAMQQVVKAPEFGFHSSIVKSADTEKWVKVDLGQESAIEKIVINPCHDEFGGIGAGFGFPVRFRIEVESNGRWQTLVEFTDSDFTNPGLTPVDVRVPLGTIPTVRRIRFTATRLADRRNDFILALAEVQALASDGTNLAIGARVTSGDTIEAPVRWARANLTDGKWATVAAPEVAAELLAVTKQHDAIMDSGVMKKLTLRQQELEASIEDVNKQLKSLPTGRMVYAAATEFKTQGNFKATSGTRRAIHVLHRGNVQQPLEVASPGLLPLNGSDDWKLEEAASEGDHRAALARWLTSRQHPLVWRSIVNRIWQYHFGRGIVSSPNDFGRMGAQPTHPELLDWLAAEFRDGGQSFKKLHRLIVCSSVYRQSSAHDQANAARDGSNQYLWRMNRRKLEAEEVRDSILSVSGALDRTMGGPGFYLFKLEKTQHSPHFEYHKFDPHDRASHRRSVYRFIARSQPDPWMTTLDCADSSQSTPRRNETLTSLQALSLLNNRFNLAMAERFAGRLRAEAASISDQVDLGFRLVVQRAPSKSEHQSLKAYAVQHGLENLARMFFNLSEFVFVD